MICRFATELSRTVQYSHACFFDHIAFRMALKVCNESFVSNLTVALNPFSDNDVGSENI